MKILIVDDEPLARERIREMLRRENIVEFISEAETGAEAVEKIISGSPDLVFLDIRMPDLNGFEVLEKLGAPILSQIPALIFVTAYDQHALRAFEFHALDYLLKPFDRERFAETLRRARAQIEKNNEIDSKQRLLSLLEKINAGPQYLEWLTIKKDERIRLLKAADVHWIEAQGNYVLLGFEENSELLRETINNLETQLDPKVFVRIHRSAIININYLKELQIWGRGEYRALMRDGKFLTLSRSHRSHFDEFLNKRST